jgi:hypothetical protein
MSIESKVFEKLFSPDKVELASQKYEFGLIEQVDQLLKDSIKNLDDINKKNLAVDKAVKLIIESMKFWSNNAKYPVFVNTNAKKLLTQYEGLAKQLGVQVKGSDFDKKINTILENANQINDGVNMFRDSLKLVPKI